MNIEIPRGITYSDPNDAVDEVERIYKKETSEMVNGYQEVISQGKPPEDILRGYYPQVSVEISGPPELEDRSVSYGYCARPGIYTSTLSRPDVMGRYYREQFALLAKHHPGVKFEVASSMCPIPMAFALNDSVEIKGKLSEEIEGKIGAKIDLFSNEMAFKPSGRTRDGTPIFPLLWANGPQTDRSFNFLTHYTGTNPEFFQKHVLFTNYQDYIDEFKTFARKQIRDPNSPFIALIQPGNQIERPEEKINSFPELFSTTAGSRPGRMPQMPAYHLVKEDGSGYSIVNIGVGPSNAKTITDHVSVLRPEAWLMVGHCAGLCFTQRKGDYVIPNGYVFEDGLMEKLIGTNIAVPELSEMHIAIKKAAEEILQQDSQKLKESVRTGVVTTLADRNWEVQEDIEGLRALESKFAINNSIAVDMEVGVIAAQGFRKRVPYGGLLCVSDRPLHGEVKMAGAAQTFYRQRTKQQFMIAVKTLENLAVENTGSVHSRKLRSDFAHVPVM